MPSRDRKLAHLPSLPCPVGEAPNTPRTGDLPRLTVDIRHPPSRTLARPRRRLAAVDWQAFSHGCRFPLVHWWSSTSDPPDPTGPLNSIETPALGCLAKGCEAEVLVDQRGQRHRAQVPLSGSWQQLHRGAPRETRPLQHLQEDSAPRCHHTPRAVFVGFGGRADEMWPSALWKVPMTGGNVSDWCWGVGGAAYRNRTDDLFITSSGCARGPCIRAWRIGSSMPTQ